MRYATLVFGLGFAMVLLGWAAAPAARQTTAELSVGATVIAACTIASAPAVLQRSAAAAGGSVCTQGQSPSTIAPPRPVVTYIPGSNGGAASLTIEF